MAKKGKGGGGGSKPASQSARKEQAKQLNKEVKKLVSQSGKLSKKEDKFIKDLINKAAQTGKKGISAAEKEVILNQARIQANDKNKIVARAKTKDIGAFIKNEKTKIAEAKRRAIETSTTVTTDIGNNIVDFSMLPTTFATSTSSVQTPGRDVVDLATPGLSAETIIGVLFEDLAATELVQFTRYDTIEGQDPRYSIISNLSNIKQKYRASDLISEQTPDLSYFSQFLIDLDSKIPSLEFLQSRSDVSVANQNNYVWFDEFTGNLIIELVNTTSDQVVEIEIDTNGTIYEVEEI
ncbi:MAG: hypothetical protein ACO295_00460 [Sediminibacterium sp.]